MYEYRATLIKVHDGDTFHCDVDCGFDLRLKMTVRLFGVNAPELVTAAGKKATAWVQAWFTDHCRDGTFTLRTEKDRREKYGRYLGTVIAKDGSVLNGDIVASGNAVVYLP